MAPLGQFTLTREEIVHHVEQYEAKKNAKRQEALGRTKVLQGKIEAQFRESFQKYKNGLNLNIKDLSSLVKHVSTKEDFKIGSTRNVLLHQWDLVKNRLQHFLENSSEPGATSSTSCTGNTNTATTQLIYPVALDEGKNGSSSLSMLSDPLMKDGFLHHGAQTKSRKLTRNSLEIENNEKADGESSLDGSLAEEMEKYDILVSSV